MPSKVSVNIHTAESIDARLREIEDRIRARAYERFMERGCSPGHDGEDWFAASAEIIETPPIALSKTDTDVTIVFSTREPAPKDLQLLVTDHALLLIGVPASAPKLKLPGVLQFCEFFPRQVVRFVALPDGIDPSSAAVEMDGSYVRVSARAKGASIPAAQKTKSAGTKSKTKSSAKSKNIAPAASATL